MNYAIRVIDTQHPERVVWDDIVSEGYILDPYHLREEMTERFGDRFEVQVELVSAPDWTLDDVLVSLADYLDETEPQAGLAGPTTSGSG